MINLPKRSDSIYEEIEAFEDYEFTNCIAYEMATRIKEVQNLINFVVLKERSEEIRTEWQKKSNRLSTEYLIDVKRITVYYLEKLKKTKDIDFDKEKFIFGGELSGKHFILTNSTTSIIYNERNSTNKAYRSRIVNLFTRPEMKLLPSQELPSLQLNLNLPKDELIAYITKIKDEYDNENSIIKNPLELLGEDFEKSNNKKINKKLIADKFFIYDYVAARLEQIKQDNLSMYEEYEEQKQEIINNKYIDVSDRKIQLKELKREFEENINIRKDELFEDIESFSSGTVKRYYYDIKPFIDDCKYKELITGITAK